MSWTDPKTWQTGEALTASDMNTHIKDNLNALKAPPTEHYECDEASDYTTTSTSFVDVDATSLSLTIVTTGGDVLIGFCGFFQQSAAVVFLDVHESVGNARLAGDDGIARPGNGFEFVSFIWLATGLDAGSHTFKLQWKVSAGTGTLYAGAGGTSLDLHPQFWVREI
jgi:hypothetical protein